jgi:tight adherence protein C
VSAWLAAGLAAIATGSALVAFAERGVFSAANAVAPPTRRRRSATVLGILGRSSVGRRVPRARLVELSSVVDAQWSPDELVGAKLAGALAVVTAALVTPAPVAVVALALVAWRGPELALQRRARRQVAEASSEVPLFLDLLAVATSAGLAPQTAVRVAGEAIVGPLARELAYAVERVDLGGRWRDELAAVAERLALGDLRRATAILARSERLGSALAEEMSRLAADVREERRSRTAERARAAPVKMLFPLVFLILPAFLLLTVVPVLLSTVRSIA